MQVVLRVIANIFGMIMGGILIYTGCQFVSYIYEIRQLSIAMRLPMHMVYAIVPVGGLLIIFRSIVDVIDTVRRFSAMGTIAAMEK